MEPRVLALPAHGQVLVVGKRLYAKCDECNSLVRLNKPILGCLHICKEEAPGK